MEEKRRASRWPFKETLAFKVVSDKEFGGCLSYDLSEGGVRFRLDNFMPLGKELLLTIPLGKEKVFEVKGQVVWVTKVPHDETYSIGVKFVDEDKDMRAKAALTRLLTQNRLSGFYKNFP